MAPFTHMFHRPLTLAVCPLAIAVLGLSACGGGTSLEEKSLKFTERDTDYFSYVDNPPKTTLTADGPKRVSNGDQATFSSDILDQSGKDVGDVDATCIFTRVSGQPRRGVSAGPLVGSNSVCTAVVTLPDGSLTASVGGKAFGEGEQSEASTRGAVVGGTGDYAGATGDFVTGGEPAHDTFHIFVPSE